LRASRNPGGIDAIRRSSSGAFVHVLLVIASVLFIVGLLSGGRTGGLRLRDPCERRLVRPARFEPAALGFRDRHERPHLGVLFRQKDRAPLAL
jgi:hypothetical protein